MTFLLTNLVEVIHRVSFDFQIFNFKIEKVFPLHLPFICFVIGFPRFCFLDSLFPRFCACRSPLYVSDGSSDSSPSLTQESCLLSWAHFSSLPAFSLWVSSVTLNSASQKVYWGPFPKKSHLRCIENAHLLSWCQIYRSRISQSGAPESAS